MEDQVSERLVPTIFHERWWLRIASGDTHKEAVVSFDGKAVARMPYVLSMKLGWQTAIIMPAMTHILGPALSPEISGNSFPRSLRRFTVICDLITQLPKASSVWFLLHRGISETLAFEAAGFSTGINFTVEITPDTHDALWHRMRDKTRNVIRRAREQLTVSELIDPEIFIRFYGNNLRERSWTNNYDKNVCQDLITEALRRKVGRILIASNQSGDLQAAIFTVFDANVEYYFMSTRTLNSMNGAVSLLIWTAIQHAASSGLTFDFDGLHMKTNFLLVTGFGGNVQPRYYVSRSSTAFRVAQSTKRMMEAGIKLLPKSSIF